MGWKTIRVRDEVYERLEARKRPGESFSELLDRIADRDVLFEQGLGALEGADFEAGLAKLDDRLDDAYQRSD